MSDTQRRTWTEAPRINHWVYEAVPGQIKGYDGEGRVMMSIETDEQFARRLVEAFGSIFKTRGSLPETSPATR
jgi:hypothetical protein